MGLGMMMCRGLELRVCLACWRNTEEVRVAGVEEGRAVVPGEEAE